MGLRSHCGIAGILCVWNFNLAKHVKLYRQLRFNTLKPLCFHTVFISNHHWPSSSAAALVCLKIRTIVVLRLQELLTSWTQHCQVPSKPCLSGPCLQVFFKSMDGDSSTSTLLSAELCESRFVFSLHSLIPRYSSCIPWAKHRRQRGLGAVVSVGVQQYLPLKKHGENQNPSHLWMLVKFPWLSC